MPDTVAEGLYDWKLGVAVLYVPVQEMEEAFNVFEIEEEALAP